MQKFKPRLSQSVRKKNNNKHSEKNIDLANFLCRYWLQKQTKKINKEHSIFDWLGAYFPRYDSIRTLIDLICFIWSRITNAIVNSQNLNNFGPTIKLVHSKIWRLIYEIPFYRNITMYKSSYWLLGFFRFLSRNQWISKIRTEN